MRRSFENVGVVPKAWKPRVPGFKRTALKDTSALSGAGDHGLAFAHEGGL